ncbi:hypothetical protein SRABI06_05624 [Pseudomonas brassicacearum]|nr:hypothetical protein SRABI06_05624 [Pseudomonas brassicacearum]
MGQAFFAYFFWRLKKSEPPSGRNPKQPLPQQWICIQSSRLREQARSHNWMGVRPEEPGRLSVRLASKLCSHRSCSNKADGVRPQEPGRLSGRLASKLCSHRSCSNKSDGCTTARARSATRPPRRDVDLRRPVNHDGRTQALRSGHPGMDAGIAALGHGWPFAAGPRSNAGVRAHRA